MMPTSDAGQRAYAAYSAAVGRATFDGKALPAWCALDDARRAGWAAAEATPVVKRWYTSKTLWLNFIGLVLACTAAAEMALPALRGLYDGNMLFVGVTFALPIFNGALRFVTQTAVGK